MPSVRPGPIQRGVENDLAGLCESQFLRLRREGEKGRYFAVDKQFFRSANLLRFHPLDVSTRIDTDVAEDAGHPGVFEAADEHHGDLFATQIANALDVMLREQLPAALMHTRYRANGKALVDCRDDAWGADHPQVGGFLQRLRQGFVQGHVLNFAESFKPEKFLRDVLWREAQRRNAHQPQVTDFGRRLGGCPRGES